MHTLYLGPSWAVQSFESVHGDDKIRTNLAQELELKNFTSLAACGDSNMTQWRAAAEFIRQHPELAPFRAIWITSNSLQDSETLLGIDRVEFAQWFICCDNVIEEVQKLERKFYQQVESLDIPVALIGAHTDIVDYDWNSNVTVINPSWQNFLARHCGLSSFFGWSADVAHVWLHGQIIPQDGSIKDLHITRSPSQSAVFEISKMLNVWHRLAFHKFWVGVHPNIKGNTMFAQAISQSVNQWLGKTSNIV